MGRRPRNAADRPQPELIEGCWLLKATSDKVLACAIYPTAAPGREGCGYGEDDLLPGPFGVEIVRGRDVAEECRQAVVANGFTEAASPC